MPLAPFIYGAIVGAVVTYVAKDKPSQEMLKDTSGKLSSGLGTLTGKVSSIIQKSEETAAEEATAKKDTDKKDTAAA